MRRYLLLLAALCFLLLAALRPASAREMTPWAVADALDKRLFEAQATLLRGDQAAAHEVVAEAEALLEGFLADTPSFPPEAAAAAREALVQAATGDVSALAAAKGQLHIALLRGSYALTQAAIAEGDVASARQWLLLRDFRAITRFDRPGANATLALDELAAGTIDRETAANRVQADLLDSYQANLLSTLETVRGTSRVATRRSEAAGMAHGYWQIVAPAFREQFGASAADAVSGHFDALLRAAVQGDEGAIAQSSAAILDAIQNFRPTPLSTEQLARRTGQLLRYIALVPVEYGRGVRGDEVVHAFEIQEADTFMRGAQAAFADLRPALHADHPEAVVAIQAQLDALQQHIQAANSQQAVLPAAELKAQAEGATRALNAILPAEWNQPEAAADFDVIATVLDQVEAAVVAGDYRMAESAHLEAYGIFDFGPEPRLLAFAPELVAHIDGLFWQGYNGEAGLASALASRESPEQIRAIRATLDERLLEAQRTLGDLPTAPAAIVTNAAIIVFREGLEAVVILAALTASFVGGMRRYRRYIGLGALAAFVATLATGAIMMNILSSFARFGERLEALISLVAIGVILLITNWFFHKVYWKDHMKGMHRQKSEIVKGGEAGRNLGLVVLGFTSIYREGFETALFLQALLLDAGPVIVLQGVFFGLLAVAAAGIATFVLQRRLPYKDMFILTGLLIAMVLVTMVGNTVHVMQKVGWMPLHPIRGLTLPYDLGLWFGIFPTWEGIGFQIAAAAFVIGSYFLAEHLRHREVDGIRERAAPMRVASH